MKRPVRTVETIMRRREGCSIFRIRQHPFAKPLLIRYFLEKIDVKAQAEKWNPDD
jgi:hypothetical protein